MGRLGRLGREVRPSISAHLELGDGGGAVVVRAEGLKLLVELVVRCHRRQVALGVERRDVSHSVTAAPCAAAGLGGGGEAALACEEQPRPDAVRARWRGSTLRCPRDGACPQRARRAIKYCSAASRAAVVRCRGVPEST